MNSDRALSQLAEIVGIVPKFRDLQGIDQQTSRETKMALLQANGWRLDNDATVIEVLKQLKSTQRKRILPEEIVHRSGKSFKWDVRKPVTWRLILEGTDCAFSEGKANSVIDAPTMPSGIHQLAVESGLHRETVRIIVAPARAPSISDITGFERLWGVNLALYGVHSNRNPSIGDYEDLANASCALAAHGADFIGINPVHAIGWNSSQVISPYSPSHRGFLNTSHIALDRIEPMSEKTRAMFAAWNLKNSIYVSDLIDYDNHAKYHLRLLRALFDDFIVSATREQKDAFEQFCEREGADLSRFTQFESLGDQYGTNWHDWPREFRKAGRCGNFENVKSKFHAWLQWQAESQLQAAQHQACSSGMALGLYLDLAVGARRDGAEAWSEQDSIAEGVSVGAPPDHLSPAGQNWNLAAFAPQKLAATDYRAFRAIIGRNMRRCGILRIDHVLGLNRSFWIPDNGTPGGYIKQNFETLLAIVRIEAERNRTIVIGEDLGLVPDGFRETLKKSGIYSYSVLQYEKNRSGSFRKPSRLRAQSLACFGTHDTPTLNGFAKGRDIDWWHTLNWIDGKTAGKLRKNRKRECVELAGISTRAFGCETPDADVVGGTGSTQINHSVHKALAASSVAMVSVQLDDIEGQVEAQNLPGTIDEHPNWRRRSVTPVEKLQHHPKLKELGRLMTENGRDNRIVTPKENIV